MLKALPTLTALIGLVIAMSCVTGCGTDAGYRRVEGATWGTTYHITYRSNSDLDDSIRAVMREVELSLSPFDKESIISAVNRGEARDIDSMITLVFNTSVMVNKWSGGAFDPTLGPLIRLWGFGEDKSVQSQPSQASVDSALLTVGIAQCRIDGKRIIKKHPLTQFNFSAITKGLGCDMVGAMLRRNGVEDYMVEIGGELAVAGHNPKGDDWRIMIDAPIANDSTPSHQRLATIQVSSGGIATSGDYRNYRRYAGGRVGHTISPVTGHPVNNTTLSATVVADNAMLADALATACMAMDADSALAMIERVPSAAALIVTAMGTDTFILRRTSDFPPIFE